MPEPFSEERSSEERSSEERSSEERMPEERRQDELSSADDLPSDFEMDFEIAADFVDATCARVFADQREIAADAERVDEDPLPRELLDAYSAPEISPDFVERAATRVAADSVARATGDAPFQEALASYAAPPSSPDFVERTLAALGVERAELRAVVGGAVTPAVPFAEAARRSRVRRLLPTAVAAAALVSALVLFGTREPTDGQLLHGVDFVSVSILAPTP